MTKRVVVWGTGNVGRPAVRAVLAHDGLELAGVVVFHAGTAEQNGKVVTSGGRVLGVTARGASLRDAVDGAYLAIANIHFEDAHYRKDIAAKAL